MSVQEIIVVIIEILYALTVISLIVLIIRENRNPQKTISWILILIFLPFIGIVFYLFFGEEHRRINSTNKKLHKDFDAFKKIEVPQFDIQDACKINPEYEKLHTMLQHIGRSPLIDGNDVEIYSDGKDMFAQFFEDIENATDNIHILFYKIIDDAIGRRFKDLLIKKVKEGVTVRVVYDDVGSIKTPKKYFNELRYNGIQVAAFLPIRPPRIARRVNYRNHRKLAIIDGKIGYLGGMNIADNYIEPISWGTKGIWRDMHIRIAGRGCYGLQAIFLVDWYYSNKENVISLEYFPDQPSQGKNLMQIVSSSPIDINDSLECGFIATINTAKRYIYIQTPYFVPSQGIMSSLKVACHSGVDVRVMMPYQSDNAFVDAATFSFIEELLRTNIKVYRYKAGFIHSKMMVIDDELSVIGSANLDIRSLELNFETTAFIYDHETALKVKAIFFDDAIDCEELTVESWNSRSVWRKMFESIMRIMSPLF